MERIKGFISNNWIFISAILFIISFLSFEIEYGLYGIDVVRYLEFSEIGIYSLRTVVQSFILFLTMSVIVMLPIFISALKKNETSNDNAQLSIKLTGFLTFIINLIVLFACLSEKSKLSIDTIYPLLSAGIIISQSIYILFYSIFSKFRNSTHITFLNLALCIFFINTNASISQFYKLQEKCNRSIKLITREGDTFFPYCNTYVAGITQKYVFLNNDDLKNSAAVPLTNVKFVFQLNSSDTTKSVSRKAWDFLLSLIENRPNPIGENYYINYEGGADPGDSNEGGVDLGDEIPEDNGPKIISDGRVISTTGSGGGVSTGSGGGVSTGSGGGVSTGSGGGASTGSGGGASIGSGSGASTGNGSGTNTGGSSGANTGRASGTNTGKFTAVSPPKLSNPNPTPNPTSTPTSTQNYASDTNSDVRKHTCSCEKEFFVKNSLTPP